VLQGDRIYYGNNVVAGQADRALGWKPTKSNPDFLASIKPEMEALAKKEVLKQLKALLFHCQDFVEIFQNDSPLFVSCKI
jgi:hypothetical protein